MVILHSLATSVSNMKAPCGVGGAEEVHLEYEAN